MWVNAMVMQMEMLQNAMHTSELFTALQCLVLLKTEAVELITNWSPDTFPSLKHITKQALFPSWHQYIFVWLKETETGILNIVRGGCL